MSKNGFIKLMRDAEELFENDLDAYLVLTQMAFRALRKDSKYNKYKLKPNQALIGDYKKLGMTEQRYRDAKDRIEKIYKQGTFKGTNKGTISTFIDIGIYDINTEENNEQKNGQGTDKERTRNGQGTTNKEAKNKEDKEFKKAMNIETLPFQVFEGSLEDKNAVLDWLRNCNINTDAKTLHFWIREFTTKKVVDAVTYMHHEINRGEVVPNPGGFIRSILDGKIVPINAESIKNCKWAEEFADQVNYIDLIIKDKCVKDFSMKEEVSTTIAHEDFMHAVKNMHQRNQNKRGIL